MTNKYKYFIGNWKMHGDFSSFKIINSVKVYLKKIRSKKNIVIFCVPSVLISHFTNMLKKTDISIGAQNCHFSESYGAFTGSVNAKMIKSAGAKYVILGHSENRLQGEKDKLINKKIKSALKNNLSVIFCIGETLKQKKQKLTKIVLLRQINYGLKSIKDLRKIIVSYEPVWSIGTGLIPTNRELSRNIEYIKNTLTKKFRNQNLIKIIYGGSVNSKNIKHLRIIKNIDGFLIGGASLSAKKFIDIIKNCYM